MSIIIMVPRFDTSRSCCIRKETSRGCVCTSVVAGYHVNMNNKGHQKPPILKKNTLNMLVRSARTGPPAPAHKLALAVTPAQPHYAPLQVLF